MLSSVRSLNSITTQVGQVLRSSITQAFSKENRRALTTSIVATLLFFALRDIRVTVRDGFWCNRILALFGNKHAYYNLGLIFYCDKTVNQNEKIAFEWLWEAGKKGHAGAYGALGDYFHNRKKTARAVEYWGKGAALGDTLSNFNLGIHFERTGYIQTAIAHYQSAEAGRHPSTYYPLGMKHLPGGILGPNFVKAGDFFERAIQAGDPRGYIGKGSVLLGQVTTTQVPAEVVQLFRKAAAQGQPAGLAALGVIYHAGSDFRRARVFYHEAVSAGDENAQQLLLRLMDEEAAARANKGRRRTR